MINNKIDKSLLQNILQYGTIGIHVIDNERKTKVYNEAMANLEGLETNKVMNKDLLEVFPSLDEETSTLIKVLNSGESIINSTQTYVNYKGKSITAISTTVPLYDKDKIIGAAEIANNLTNIKILSDQLMDLQKELTMTKTSKQDKTPIIEKYNFSHIIGNSKNLSLAKEVGKRASNTPSSVLIYGETGTGKELFAQSIHNEGNRKNKPFIAQNCAAIPESLLEGILFGTEKGGFTGAISREGIFEQAQGGTLLLDEINSMSLPLQAKILRVLQEGYVRRIGGNKDIPIDVRIIATTNVNPIDAINNNTIRKDLYYRLSVVNITIPPLRERIEDIGMLVNHFINKYNIILNKNIINLEAGVLKELMDYSWPGNIRELENFIEAAMNMAPSHSSVLKKENFISSIFIHKDKSNKKEIELKEDQSLPMFLEEVEKQLIIDELKANTNNITHTAHALGIKRQTLQHKLRKFNIEQ